MTTTVNELIERLKGLGDDSWRNSAVVRIVNSRNSDEIATVDAYDIKYTTTSADILV